MLKTELRRNNTDAIIQTISKLDVVNYENVSHLLPTLLAKSELILDHSVYEPIDPKKPDGIGRYLVYDHPDKSNPFSIWAFAFAPRQKTLIHDHKYKGTVTVLNGAVSEKYYEPTGKKSARLVRRIDRYQFHSNRDDLNDVYVHQLKFRKGLDLDTTTSVTLHIYNMEAQYIDPSGEIKDRRNFDKIYSKEKILDKSSIPPYKKADSEEDEVTNLYTPN